MENTCNPDECKWHDLLGGKPEQCPNYIETWWTADDKEPILVKDCSPRRTLLMIQELYNRTIALQQSNEQQRNTFAKAVTVFKLLKDGVDSSKGAITYDP